MNKKTQLALLGSKKLKIKKKSYVVATNLTSSPQVIALNADVVPLLPFKVARVQTLCFTTLCYDDEKVKVKILEEVVDEGHRDGTGNG